MDIRSVPTNSSLRVYYKADDLQSGADVVFNIWNSEGTQLNVNTPADGEIGSRGVYYLDITTPATDTYLLVRGSLSTGDNPVANVFLVGSAKQKAFYVHGAFRTGQSLTYRIFDIDDAELANTALTEVGGGFYYADVSNLNSESDLIFVVGTTAFEFDLTGIVIASQGGVVIGGVSTQQFIAQPSVSGGVVLGGVAEETFVPGLAGGVVIGGAAIIGIQPAISGGTVIGGTTDPQTVFNVTASGGTVISGTADEDFSDVVESTGGSTTSGTAEVYVIYNTASAGGIVVSGDSTVQAAYNITSTGGVVVAGEISFSDTQDVSGGVVLGGVAGAYTVYNPASTGGVVVGGEARLPTEYDQTAQGGSVLGGVAEVSAIYNTTSTGGVLVSGDSPNSTFIVTIGGVVVGGETETSIIVGVRGGVVCGGEASVSVTYTNTTKVIRHRYKIGDHVYLIGVFFDERYIPLPRFFPHMVRGVRILGDDAYYDLGFGYISESFLFDQIPSSEYALFFDWIGYRLGILSNILPISNPSGGTITTKSEENTTRPDPYKDLAKRIDALNKIVAQNNPAGGKVTFGETEGAQNPDLSKITSRLQFLDQVSPAATPSGSIVYLKEAEGGTQTLYNKFLKGLRRLESVATIPDPTGGTITVSSESSRKTLSTKGIENRLQRLEQESVNPDPTPSTIVRQISASKRIEDIEAKIQKKLASLNNSG